MKRIYLDYVNGPQDLIDPKTGRYYTDEIHVLRNVILANSEFSRLPVKFGTVGGFFCCDNQLTSLQGAPSSVGDHVYCSFNQLTSLEGIHKLIKKINGTLYCHRNPIKTGGIGLILIEGLRRIDADQLAFEIINKYIGQGKKGLLYCQDELIEANLEEYAKL